MKAKLLSHEIRDYDLEVEIENEGEVYLANIHYDIYDGFDVIFVDKLGKEIPMPQWAIDLQETNEDSLGYMIESETKGWFRWVEEVGE